MIRSSLLAALLFFPARAGALDFSYRVVSSVRLPGEIEETITFPSAVKSPFPANDVVWGHFYAPDEPGRHPCVLVLPVMAAPNVWIEQHFVDALRKKKFAVLWIEMPYQFHRRPGALIPSGQVFLARTAPRLAANFRQSIADAKRALAWLSAQDSVDPKRLGLFGVSLGGLVGSAVYSTDDRPKYAVFLLAGADFPDLVAASAMTGPFIAQAGISIPELRENWKGLDPLDYKESNAGKKVLLINALWDAIIPRENAVKLKDAFPQSRQMWVPFGHYSSLIHLFWIPRFVARQFSANL